MQPDTFLWHDYETFGRDPSRERPVQFAAIRTDNDLNELEESMIYCQQSADYLPDPESCLVHGVLPQTANDKGLSEYEFASAVHQLMSQPGSCVTGYNNIRFDDEFTRQLFFRNLYDPYSREWKNGNSRWDLIDVVRLTRALRPEGINWPCDDDGNPVNKLERLTEANDIPHGDAHDALADVRATIAIARLIRRAQPRLFDYTLKMRLKKNVAQALNTVDHTPVLHVSGMYSGRNLNLSMVTPLCQHPSNPNGVLAYDLRQAPEDLIELTAEQIAERLFTRTADLPEQVERIAIKTIHLNRCPAIAPMATLTGDNVARLALDIPSAMRNREQLVANIEQIIHKLSTIFKHYAPPAQVDPELTLYSGSFANDHDRQMMTLARKHLSHGDIATDTINFQDTRLNELFFRVRARNRSETLTDSEMQRWKTLCNSRVHQGREGFRSIAGFEQILAEMHLNCQHKNTATMVAALTDYGRTLAAYSDRPDIL